MMTCARPPVMRATNSAAKSMRRLGYSALLHEQAGDDEERQCQERKRVQYHQHSLTDHHERQIGTQNDREDRSHSHRHGDRRTDREQHEKAAEKQAQRSHEISVGVLNGATSRTISCTAPLTR